MMMILKTATASTATQHLIHNLILHPLRRTTTAISLLRRTRHLSSPLHITRPFSSSTTLHCTLAENTLQDLTETKEEDLEERENPESEEGKNGNNELGLVKRQVPVLSVKEKKELGSYAQSLGDKLKSQQIGKSGVTNNVLFAFDETLEKREFLKLKIHRSCPGELEDIVKQLEEGTGSVVVGHIGRTVILYRPSITKLKAAEKKEQNRKIFELRKQKFQAALMMRKNRTTREQPGRAPGPFAKHRSEKVPS